MANRREHEFQTQNAPRDSMADMAMVPRNIGDRAVSRYAGQPADIFQANPDFSPAPSNANEKWDFRKMLYAMQRRGNFQQLQTVLPQAAINILPATGRLYFLIQNLSTTAVLWIGIGRESSGATSTGIRIAPAGGYYEPLVCPQEDIYISGDIAGGFVNILYANSAD